MTDEILYVRKKLPVWALTKRSYGFVWNHARLLAVPLLLVLAVQIGAGFVAGLTVAGIVAMVGRWALLLNLAWSLLIAMVTMSFIVGLHRTVLLDEVRPGAAFLRWDSNLWNYLKTCLWTMVIGLAAAVAIGLALFVIFGTSNLMSAFLFKKTIVMGGFSLAFIPGLLLSLKIALAFPAAALGHDDVFNLSWRLTTGNLLRLLAAFLLVSLPFLLASILLGLPILLGATIGTPSVPRVGMAMLILVLANAIIRLALVSVMTVALSLSFFFLYKVADEAGDLRD